MAEVKAFQWVPALYTTAVRSPAVDLRDAGRPIRHILATAHSKHPTWIAKYLVSRMMFQIFPDIEPQYDNIFPMPIPMVFPMKHGPKLFLSAPLGGSGQSGQKSRRHLWDVRSMLLADKLWGSTDGKLRKTTSEF